MITLATDTDLSELVPLLRDLNAQHTAYVPERFRCRGTDADLLGLLRSAAGRGTRFLIYRTEGVPRGYLGWRPHPVPEGALLQPRLALLDHITVEPIWRRRGLATRLIARFEVEVAAFDGWMVQGHAFNAASRALMRRYGTRLMDGMVTPDQAGYLTCAPSAVISGPARSKRR
ncbi:GNAT family N-acetyltransferase [Sagittula salina]|uniref:GNAT family N-acetyltransferase n=1 Tax=Sagittula salina TaxID=2820268 RepID=A0A940S3T1_9RHOB|nr:GNAT family N-acetyltransferase [Sagittula salina]MBP0483379.1 GNAT family N-acetyltransferase [Sagittula salina]